MAGSIVARQYGSIAVTLNTSGTKGTDMRARHFLLALALPAISVPALPCNLKLAFEHWPPYVYRDAQARPTGLDFELVAAILKEARCTLVVEKELPAARRQMLFQQGELDLMLAASETKDRQAYARFSVAYRHESVGLFTMSAKLAKYRHLDTFAAIQQAHVPLLAPRVGWYGRDYARAMPGLEASGSLNTFGSFRQGIRMLDAERAELILGDSAALRYEAKRQGLAIAALPFVVLRAPVHLMLNASSTSQAELDDINAAIARLEKRGTLPAIRARYGEH
ncbi:substrate-binding periplasmic protein [Janthinobacterium fluminis]|uniref:Transporter substrate-binding domain-containing protein n=1 Tax=Janthinobacterium fluminis TaxID=2987524 RepID=A0ABT5K5B6_9BURK|nr:transporter substrate-binding domain-containing protein [Janthinobacterium fluminis]MDC8760194.1 transporter substrate-binding domain-containing protein [Janthinobacterium fluminis]